MLERREGEMLFEWYLMRNQGRGELAGAFIAMLERRERQPASSILDRLAIRYGSRGMQNVVDAVAGKARKEPPPMLDSVAGAPPEVSIISGLGAFSTVARVKSTTKEEEAAPELVVHDKHRIGADGKQISHAKAKAQLSTRAKPSVGAKTPLKTLWRTSVKSKEFTYLSVPRLWIFGGLNVSGETASVVSWTGESEVSAVGRAGGSGSIQRKAINIDGELDINNMDFEPRPRTAAAATTVIGKMFLLGGYSSHFGALRSVLSRDKKVPVWTNQRPLKSRRDGLGAASFEISSDEAVVIAIAGSDGQTLTASVEKCHVVQAANGTVSLGSWVDLPDLQRKRGNLAAVVDPLAERGRAEAPPVYAIGGYLDAVEVSRQVEVLDWEQDAWINVCPLIKARAMHAACMHKGRIWVVGGTDGTNALSSVEAMDPREGAWKEMIPLRKTRAGCACAELNGKLVVTSGRQYSDCISTAEFTAEERAKARADITYRQLRVKEFVDTVEIWDDRALKWDELTHRSGDKENGFDRAVAAYTVL